MSLVNSGGFSLALLGTIGELITRGRIDYEENELEFGMVGSYWVFLRYATRYFINRLQHLEALLVHNWSWIPSVI